MGINNINSTKFISLKLNNKPPAISYAPASKHRVTTGIGLGIMGALTLGGITCGTVGPGKILELVTSSESNVLKETTSPVGQEAKHLLQAEHFGQNWGGCWHFWHGQPEKLPVERILKLRAEYNISKNANILNPYLPYRHSIKNNPDKLAAYENMVKYIQNKASLGFITETVDKWEAGSSTKTNPLDPSTSYMVAATITELTHNCPKLVGKVLNPPKKQEDVQRKAFPNFPAAGYGFGVRYYTKSKAPCNLQKATVGRFFNTINSFIVENETYWKQTLIKNNADDTVIHEFIHALDNGGTFDGKDVDGILPGMTKNQEKQFCSIQNELFQKFKQNDKNIDPAKKPDTITSTGLRAYAFSNKLEFLAVTVETFYKQPKTLYDASPNLYNFYRDYFKLDPLNGYKDL